MIYRLKSAWRAFRDPWLVGEALGMRNSLHDLYIRGDFAVLRAEVHNGHLIPIIKHLPYDWQQQIKDKFGV